MKNPFESLVDWEISIPLQCHRIEKWSISPLCFLGYWPMVSHISTATPQMKITGYKGLVYIEVLKGIIEVQLPILGIDAKLGIRHFVNAIPPKLPPEFSSGRLRRWTPYISPTN